MSKRVRTLGLTLLVLCLLAGCAQPAPTATPRPQPTQAPPTAAPPPPPTPTPVPKEKVYRAATFEPDSLDPSKGGPGFDIYQNLYEPLVDGYAKDGEIHPLAAESYEVSADGLTWTFKLRPKLKWSDGVPVVAEHYRSAWLRQLNPATAAYGPDYLYAIVNAKEYNQGEITDPDLVGLEAPDDRTLVVQLKESAPYFLRYVGMTDYYPIRMDILEKYGDQWMEAGNFVGNGPYMLQEWKHDQRIVLVKNPYYEGPWKDTRHVDRVEYTLMQDPWSQAVPGYEADELDVARLPEVELDRILADPTLSEELVRVPSSGADILVFDTKNPPTDDVLVRQALNMAIDRETLANNVLKGAYPATDSFSPPDLDSYNPSTFLGYDPAGARAKLAEAGYPDGQGFPVIDLTHWTPERASLSCQAIQAMWKENLGIDVNLVPLDIPAMANYRSSRKTESYNVYYALNVCGILDPSEFHNAQLDPDQNVRWSRYDDPKYVQLIRDGLKENDPVKRKEMYQEAEMMVNRDVPIASLTGWGSLYLVKPRVKNWLDVTTTVVTMIRIASPPGLDIVE